MRVTRGPGSCRRCARVCSAPPPPPVGKKSGHFPWDPIPPLHPPGARSGMTSPALEERSLIHTMSKPKIKGHAPKKLDQIYEIKLDGGFAGQL